MNSPIEEPLDIEVAITMMQTAFMEALASLEEGGIPIGAAMFDREGVLIGAGHNLRVQEDDPSMHAETAAFRSAGRRRDYSELVMVTTLSPCWYCAGLIKQFNIGAVVIGETANFQGTHEWLREQGVEVLVLDDPECTEQLERFIRENPELWNEDIGL